MALTSISVLKKYLAYLFYIHHTFSHVSIPQRYMSFFYSAHSLFFFNFYTYDLTCSIGKLLGQGLNLSNRCNPFCSYGNARSFNTLRWERDWTKTSAMTRTSEVGFLIHCTTQECPPHCSFFKLDSFTYFFSFLFFLIFRTIAAAYGTSQARGPMRASAASLHHNHKNKVS